jgi:hypothetical protein
MCMPEARLNTSIRHQQVSVLSKPMTDDSTHHYLVKMQTTRLWRQWASGIVDVNVDSYLDACSCLELLHHECAIRTDSNRQVAGLTKCCGFTFSAVTLCRVTNESKSIVLQYYCVRGGVGRHSPKTLSSGSSTTRQGIS